MSQMRLAGLAAVGAAIGSLARYAVALLVPTTNATQVPWHTLMVNVIGALLIGICASNASVMASEARRIFLMTGVLGGFTTFSALAVETQQLLHHPVIAILYIAVTFIGGVTATHIGTRLRASR